MHQLFQQQSQDLQVALQDVTAFHQQIMAVAHVFRAAFQSGHKILVAGNGGSAAEAQHLSDEMMGRYAQDRPAYPVIALTADSMVITCIGNDYGYDQVFKRQVEGLGQMGDIFVGLTTSGTSKNILLAAEQAKSQGLIVVALTGPRGTFKDLADQAIVSPTDKPPRMQELHLHAIHLLCELFEPANLDQW